MVLLEVCFKFLLCILAGYVPHHQVGSRLIPINDLVIVDGASIVFLAHTGDETKL